MINSPKRFIKKLFNLIGLDIIRISKDPKHTLLGLKNLPIRTIIDVGANRGQFARYIHGVFPEAMIYSFEPLWDCCSVLTQHMQGIKKFKAFMLALGDFNGVTFIHRNDHTPSSSILAMSESHKDLFPYTRNAAREKIKIMRLDDVVSAFDIVINNDILIKLDVQGYEDRVIRGGKRTFSKAHVVIAEVSFMKLYRQQVLFDGLYTLLRDLGFMYVGNLKQLLNPNNGRPVQADAVFVKSHAK